MSPPSSDASMPPEVLLRSGRASYEFVKSLGAAHHGELLLARRRYEADFCGYAVIKRPLGEDAAAIHRLLEEGRLTALLHHPNVASVHHLKGPDDTPVLVFEHTPGHRLDSLLEASSRSHLPFSEGFALYVAAEIAEALHHAHTLTDEHGHPLRVVHRDVAPHNILVTEHGAVKLLDFGAATSVFSGDAARAAPPVSLAYAAPEHVARQPLDGRADLFGLGLVLLQLLTGRHLFEGADRFEAERRHRHERALTQPPSDSGEALEDAMKNAVGLAAARELRRRIRAIPRKRGMGERSADPSGAMPSFTARVKSSSVQCASPVPWKVMFARPWNGGCPVDELDTPSPTSTATRCAWSTATWRPTTSSSPSTAR
ncbi:serine/threonine protein kinase [Myxococcus fulvus 124B02]|nr:serine/threonine protein kinase [Myxococcus fulvus 124B02]